MMLIHYESKFVFKYNLLIITAKPTNVEYRGTFQYKEIILSVWEFLL